MGIHVEIGEDEINLTDFTVTEITESNLQPTEDNMYLSRKLEEVQLKGQFKVMGKSDEKAEIYKLADWSILSAHEKKVYKSLKLICTDSNNKVYDELVFDKSFVVEFFETYNQGAGTIDFQILIKRFDDVTEKALKF